MITNTLEKLQTRRDALFGQRFDVVFYGGWYVLDNQSTNAWRRKKYSDALDFAEELNENQTTNTHKV